MCWDHPLGAEISRCIKDPLVALCRFLPFGSVVVSLTYSSFPSQFYYLETIHIVDLHLHISNEWESINCGYKITIRYQLNGILKGFRKIIQ